MTNFRPHRPQKHFFKSFKFCHIHPIIFSLYPALGLLASNFGHTAIFDVIRPLAFSFLISIFIFFIVRLIIPNWNKAAIITTLLLVIFFGFGHLYDTLKTTTILNISIGRIRYLLPTIFVFTAILIIVILKSRRLNYSNLFITFSSIVLVVYSLSHITKLKLSEDHVRKLADQSQFDTENTNEVFNGVKRDIYYIILDAYTRDDHLLSEFQFDNSEFLSELEDLGFYIARCSQPNYPSTALAMASTLNFEYLDSLAPDIINNNYSWVNFKPYIDNNRTTQFFQNLGYTYITAQTSFDWINNPNSDIYLRRYTIGGAIIELTAFETMFLNSTIFRSVKGIDFLPNIKNVATYEESHYETILSTLDKMDKIIAISGPKFSYIHIAVPHRPYIFTPEGDFFITEDPSVGYINNIQFINNQIIPVLKDLISKSEPAPIIIVQGDHGHGSSSNFILNAYYLPNGMDTTLYSTISPVNTFRLLMDNYFGTSLGLLDDISYTWKYGDVYKFGIAADDCHR